MKISHFLIIISMLITSRSTAQELMDPNLRDEFLTDMVKSFEEEFLWTGKGKEIAEKLRSKIEDGDYSHFIDAELFAATFTRDLFVLSNDRHLTVELKPKPQKENGSKTEKEMTSVFTAEKVDKGIYYLKFDEFPRLDESLENEVDQIMSSMTNPESIIIDLRDNYGGSDQTVNFLAGYFFTERTKLAHSYQWGQGPEEIWAEPKKLSEHIAKAQVIILTSEATFSAAEIFTQRLQSHNKAIVIGEKTKGGAHRSATYLMSDLFLLNWPYERSEHAISKQDIEGKGIEPNVYAHYNDAKNIAIAYSKNIRADNTKKTPRPNTPLLLKAILEYINASTTEKNIEEFLTAENKEKVLATLNRFKTVWNRDGGAKINNTHFLDDGNLRLVVNTSFGEVFLKLIMKEGRIENLLYRL